MERHGVGRGRVLLRPPERRDHAVGFRRASQVDRRLREVEPRLGQPHVLDGLRGRHRDHQRSGIGQADVLARVDDHPPGDIPRVLARLEHPGQPEQGRVRIGPPDALDERRDHLVMRVALPVVDDRLLLDRVGRTLAGNRLLPGRAGRQDRGLQAGERDPGVAAGNLDEVLERLVRDLDALLGQAAVLVGQGVLEQRPELLRRQRFELREDAAREQRRDEREVGVLGGRADQGDRPLLDRRQEDVLLRLGPPVDLVDEQHRPEEPALGLLDHLPSVGHT
jgi:hypothetical protein